MALEVVMSKERELPDADCKNCYYKLGSYAESTYQWCYMFKESPGNKCGQFRTIKTFDGERK